MNIKKRIIHDPYLDEFLYNLIYNSTRQQRERFAPEFLGVFRTSKNAKTFIARATMEQKLYFLSMLGVDWFLMCGTRKNATSDIKEIISQFKKGSSASALNTITQKNIFLISGDQYMDYLGIMASVTHHKTYSYNVEMMKTGYHLKKWKKDVEFKRHIEVSENTESNENIIRFVKSIILNNKGIETNHSIKETDLLILSFLYEKKNMYVEVEKIVDYFAGFYKKADISNSLRLLRQINLIRLSAIADSREYAITSLGIEKLHNFIKRTLTAYC